MSGKPFTYDSFGTDDNIRQRSSTYQPLQRGGIYRRGLVRPFTEVIRTDVCLGCKKLSQIGATKLCSICLEKTVRGVCIECNAFTIKRPNCRFYNYYCKKCYDSNNKSVNNFEDVSSLSKVTRSESDIGVITDQVNSTDKLLMLSKMVKSEDEGDDKIKLSLFSKSESDIGSSSLDFSSALEIRINGKCYYLVPEDEFKKYEEYKKSA